MQKIVAWRNAVHCCVDHRGRGVSESPWVAGGSERVRGTDVPQVGDRLDIATELACKNRAECWKVLQGEESHKEKDLDT